MLVKYYEDLLHHREHFLLDVQHFLGLQLHPMGRPTYRLPGQSFSVDQRGIAFDGAGNLVQQGRENNTAVLFFHGHGRHVEQQVPTA